MGRGLKIPLKGEGDIPPKGARRLALTIAGHPKMAIQYAKEAVLRYCEGSFATGLAHESYLHALSCGTEDKREGISAFMEKRKPRFVGR